MNIPHIVNHQNMEPLLEQLQKEPEFKCGACNKALPQYYKPTGKEWYRQKVILEFPTGELGHTGLANICLCGFQKPIAANLDGTERFNANGLEGKVQVTHDLFGALMKLRDLLPPWRGRIVVNKTRNAS